MRCPAFIIGSDGWPSNKPSRTLRQGLLPCRSELPNLLAYLADGRIEVDNNLIENAIRPLALGRKNYLFAGSHQGARRAAMMYSFFATCKTMDINPWAWLSNVLDRIGTQPINQVDELLPHCWKKEMSKT